MGVFRFRILPVALFVLSSLLFCAKAEAATWYVNDASTVGDSFASAMGNNGNSGTAPDAPNRTITAVMR